MYLLINSNKPKDLNTSDSLYFRRLKKMENKKLEILVVEDTIENMKVAQNYFNQKKDIAVDYATDYNQAIKKIKNKKYNGLITDLFMPEKKGAERDFFLLKDLFGKIYNKIYQDFEEEIAKGEGASDYKLNYCYELKDYIFSKKGNAPFGLLIAEKAEEMGIPYVIATSLFHHNHLAEPVNYYGYNCLKNFSVHKGCIVTGDKGENVKLKQEYWEEAYAKLNEKINERRSKENGKRKF